MTYLSHISKSCDVHSILVTDGVLPAGCAALRLLTMAALGGQLLSITVSIDYPQALAALLKVRT
jgi:hypothetical protein